MLSCVSILFEKYIMINFIYLHSFPLLWIIKRMRCYIVNDMSSNHSRSPHCHPNSVRNAWRVCICTKSIPCIAHCEYECRGSPCDCKLGMTKVRSIDGLSIQFSARNVTVFLREVVASNSKGTVDGNQGDGIGRKIRCC
jgi:hypothetical protein